MKNLFIIIIILYTTPVFGEKSLDLMLKKAVASQACGDFSQALEIIPTALQIAQNLPEKHYQAMVFSRIGDLYLSLGYVEKALGNLEKGEDAAIQAGHAYTLAHVLNNTGNCLAARRDYDRGLAAYQEALSLLDHAPQQHNQELGIRIMLNSARVYQALKQTEKLNSTLTRAFKMTNELLDSHSKISILLSLGLLGKNTALHKALDLAGQLQDFRSAARACGYLGHWYEQKQDYTQALDYTRQAILWCQQGRAPEILYLWLQQLGRIFKARHELEPAIKAYRQALTVLNPIRTRLYKGLREQQDIFNRKVKPVYLELTELLLTRAETMPEQNQEPILREARAVMEKLKTVELQEYFQDECVIQRRSRKVSVRPSDNHSAVLYPIAMHDSLAILISLESNIRFVRVPVKADQLNQTVIRVRAQLQDTQNTQYLQGAEKLYAWLIQPIEDLLQQAQIHTLIVAPDGILRTIPFAALYDGEKFLIEKYAVVTVPAMTLTATDPSKHKQNQNKILLEGLSKARHGFAPLPNVTLELAGIQKVMGGKINQDQDYTTANLKDEFASHTYSYVHIATHGVFGGNAANTFLLTYDGRLSMDQLEKMLKGSPVELLTLSACQTALGDERAAFGLAGIAVKAGVSSAVATLWFVDDIATAEAMTTFYRELKKTELSKAKALQNTQKYLINQPRFRHPAYWAPFLLIGNWS